MSQLLPFIVAGLAIGSVYGMAGVGLVLTNKTSGIFNFAFGSIATVAAFLFYTLADQHGMGWVLAMAISVLGLGVVIGLLLEVYSRFLIRASLTLKVVGMLGLVLIVEAAVLLVYGDIETRSVSQYLPTSFFRIDGTVVTYANLILIALPIVVTVVLYIYFRVTRTGIAMRAVVDDPDLLDLNGIQSISIRRRSWIISSIFACLSGVIFAPLLAQIDGITITFLVITAFGAAAIGGFNSLPWTYAGGLIIGVAGSIATKYLTTGFMAQLPTALPFVILFLYLVVAPRSRSRSRDTRVLMRSESTWRAPISLQLGGGVMLFTFLLFVPAFAGVHLGAWSQFLPMVIVFLSLGLLARTSGQVSLSHIGFVAIGAIAFSHFTSGQHLPWLIGLLFAGLVAVPIGALLAIPAIRHGGIYLALATLGFGIVLNYMFFTASFMFGNGISPALVPRPEISWLNVASDKGYYYLLLAFTVFATLSVITLTRTRLGRLLRASSGSSIGLATSGTSINVTRVLVFCLSAFLAAIAGGLAGAQGQVLSSSSYPPIQSIILFAVVMISVGSEPWYAILGAAGIVLIPSYFQNVTVTNVETLLFGVAAMAYAIAPSQGVPSRLRDIIDARRRRPPNERADDNLNDIDRSLALAPPVKTSILTIHNVTVRFGGIVAVSDISLEAPTGRITGLIGPNGAGKTTIFNVCSGLQSSNAGTVELDGRSVGRLGVAARAREGIGRTFQQTELFDRMTVGENVALGAEAHFAGHNPIGHFMSTRRQRLQVVRASSEALSICSLQSLVEAQVGTLSTGQRRLVELARCLAGPHRIILLDEPSAGLDRIETEAFGRILQHVVSSRGVGILIVEHDMSLVTSICDYIYVMDFGHQIFQGTPVDVISSPLVQAAYLGEAVPELVMSDDDQNKEPA